MQKKLFQTLLIAAIIGASVGQAYAQQGGSCMSQGTKEEMAQWCGGWANVECPSANNGVCLTDYKSECPWCFCVCSSSTSPDKEDMKDKRVERHQEVINKNSDANGNASE